jgi:hypothetical protein
MAANQGNWIATIGAVFLGIAAYRFLTGADGWIVWLLLGFLLGGFGFFSKPKTGGKP